MGDIFPFVARVRDSGDRTAAERVLNMAFNDPNHDPSDPVLVAVGHDFSYPEIG